MEKILLFAGTTEGRILAEFLMNKKIATHVCVATEYGESLLPHNVNGLSISSNRLTQKDMLLLLQNNSYNAVIDATHPYATIVSKNIHNACKQTNSMYYRVIRKNSNLLLNDSSIVFVNTIEDAVQYLNATSGNIFISTGSKELSKYCAIKDYENRIYARILSVPEAVKACYDLGIKGNHLICMQGPFTQELNQAMFKHVKAKFLVTKESGLAGGFSDKILAAKALDMTSIIIGRPPEGKGVSLEEMKRIICTQFH